MKVDSDPEDDSVLFSCVVVVPTAVACAILVLLVRCTSCCVPVDWCSRSSSTTVVACILLDFLVFALFALCSLVSAGWEDGPFLSWNGEDCTVGASVFYEFHLKSGQYFDERLLFGRLFSPSGRFLSTVYSAPEHTHL